MEPRNEERRQRFGLWAAVVLSILLHAILVLITVWFPLTRGASVAVADVTDDVITFKFDREAEATTEDPMEDAPFAPEEPRPTALPSSVPIPASPDSPPVEALEPLPEERPADRLPEAEESPDPLEEIEREQPPGAELAERPDGLYRQAPPDPRGSPDSQVDMAQALRDFGRALASRPPPKPTPQAGQGTPKNDIRPDPTSVPPSGFGVGNLVFESRDYDWSDYGRQVYMAIWRAWHRRLYVTTDDFEKWAYHNENWRLDHTTQVKFVIESNGQVTGFVEESGSGCGPLDVSVADALSEVILPPLPVDFPRDREVVRARFMASGPIRAMRPVLRRYKLMGYF